MTMHVTAPFTAGDGEQFPHYDAKDLTRGQGQARIVLDDKTYTLRITRAGKLILTK
ncbi:MAG: hemin uptake protein HemP [Paracoccaceae bacterium]